MEKPCQLTDITIYCDVAADPAIDGKHKNGWPRLRLINLDTPKPYNMFCNNCSFEQALDVTNWESRTLAHIQE